MKKKKFINIRFITNIICVILIVFSLIILIKVKLSTKESKYDYIHKFYTIKSTYMNYYSPTNKNSITIYVNKRYDKNIYEATFKIGESVENSNAIDLRQVSLQLAGSDVYKNEEFNIIDISFLASNPCSFSNAYLYITQNEYKYKIAIGSFYLEQVNNPDTNLYTFSKLEGHYMYINNIDYLSGISIKAYKDPIKVVDIKCPDKSINFNTGASFEADLNSVVTKEEFNNVTIDSTATKKEIIVSQNNKMVIPISYSKKIINNFCFSISDGIKEYFFYSVLFKISNKSLNDYSIYLESY